MFLYFTCSHAIWAWRVLESLPTAEPASTGTGHFDLRRLANKLYPH